MSTRTGDVTSVVLMPPTGGEAWVRGRAAPVLAGDGSTAPRHPARVVVRMAPSGRRAPPHAHPLAWREVVQAFAHDTAELPLFSRLLAGQGFLLLGVAGVYGALAWRGRQRGASSSRVTRPTRARRQHPLLVGGLAATGLVLAWAAAAFVARLHVIPAVTALFTYGHALRQYARPLRPPTRAA